MRFYLYFCWTRCSRRHCKFASTNKDNVQKKKKKELLRFFAANFRKPLSGKQKAYFRQTYPHEALNTRRFISEFVQKSDLWHNDGGRPIITQLKELPCFSVSVFPPSVLFPSRITQHAFFFSFHAKEGEALPVWSCFRHSKPRLGTWAASSTKQKYKKKPTEMPKTVPPFEESCVCNRTHMLARPDRKSVV